MSFLSPLPLFPLFYDALDSSGTNPCKLDCQTPKSQHRGASNDGGGVHWADGGNRGVSVPSAEVMIKFWKEVIKPSVFDHVERREQAILRAALCDCLTEIGEAVFSILPQVPKGLSIG